MQFSLVAVALFVASAMSQAINISSPPSGQTVLAGEKLDVEVTRQNSLTPSEEVAIVIGVSSCTDENSCPNPSQAIQHVLYNGKYEAPHQNITVTLPSSLNGGHAVLSVTHFSLVGAGYTPTTQIAQEPLYVGISASGPGN
ncbi:hypothetical protein CONPUDRAFT_165348 [Coniophora puteana RWD-64-598 SS2]|uniref:Phosphatidylglycerol/phosphatidylinositol transfer protein n=1 Tax=Coniophora puteana (strain RWD-64-598) TaxID=741705 RepID=A0A5M3MPX9_CONPW|nr:uncharacterized protein CONPUDRAFT_165348 [Coniophora puteana RWD-64-598 SS2]EIW81130.1 hypothetical protein CONPUDRAFT_165348 [Coniophora puteana RWD-64-598 SS2]